MQRLVLPVLVLLMACSPVSATPDPLPAAGSGAGGGGGTTTPRDAGDPWVAFDGGWWVKDGGSIQPPTTDLTCAGSLLTCADQCLDLAVDIANCGACGRACSAGEVCNAGTCTFLPSDCTVTPCAVGYSCDPSSRRCVEGCRVPSECPTGTTCSAGRRCECPTGQHLCGQRCVPSESVSSCGNRCEACPTSPNAVSVCEQTSTHGLTCMQTCHEGWETVIEGCDDRIRSWKRVESARAPVGFDSLAFDSTNAVALGLDYEGSTWRWQNGIWSRVAVTSALPARRGSAMAFDESTGRFVVFGGQSPARVNLNDTWVFSGAAWSELHSKLLPSARYAHGLVYDPDARRVLLVGGGTESFWSVGVWQLKAGEWTMVEGLTTLPASAYASLAYDVHAHQLVIASSTFLELGLSGVVTWDGVSATWGSQAADIDGLVYDPERKRLLGVGASTLERGGGRWVYRTARLAGAGHWDDRFFFDAKNHRALAFLGVGELWAFVP